MKLSDHDFIVTYTVTVTRTIAAATAADAKRLVDILLEGEEGDHKILSIVRADLKPEDVFKPDFEPKPTKPGGRPSGKPSPSGGTPGAGKVFRPINTTAVAAAA